MSTNHQPCEPPTDLLGVGVWMLTDLRTNELQNRQQGLAESSVGQFKSSRWNWRFLTSAITVRAEDLQKEGLRAWSGSMLWDLWASMNSWEDVSRLPSRTGSQTGESCWEWNRDWEKWRWERKGEKRPRSKWEKGAQINAESKCLSTTKKDRRGSSVKLEMLSWTPSHSSQEN